MKDVIIKIKGTQGLEGTEEEVIELTTVGTLETAHNEIILCYDEGEMMGAKNLRTKLSVKGSDTVIMERSGEMSSRLVIEKGIRNNCYYSTPYGELVIGIFGESIKNRLTENGGELSMSYTLDQNLHPMSRNTVDISVKLA